MVVYCYVEVCTSTLYKKKSQENQEPVSFHKFPSDPNLRAQWIKALVEGNHQLNADTLPQNPKICNLHFRMQEVEKTGFMHLRLKPKSVPSIFPNARRESTAICQLVEDPNLKASQCNNALLTEPVEIVQSVLPIPGKLVNYKEFDQHGVTDDQQETEITIEQMFATPQKRLRYTEDEPISTTPKKTVRYPGDVLSDKIPDMSPHTMTNKEG
ncbi:uncharacterized protein LOC105286906 [Ooceraea biroi]|uniref:uncharacterized protein LOC105286906 n=1 Tax=Ooceraea biroi TaxID=2015173 RepID=UPI000F073B0A|nr:uncharacterized protein LOC105286906 [Ooceraea biroi]